MGRLALVITAPASSRTSTTSSPLTSLARSVWGGAGGGVLVAAGERGRGEEQEGEAQGHHHDGIVQIRRGGERARRGAMSTRPTVLPPAGAADVLYLIDFSGYVFRAYHAI